MTDKKSEPTSPPQGLSFYEIVNNPKLLKQMTVEEGEDLTHSEQVAKLERLMNKRVKPRHTKPPF